MELPSNKKIVANITLETIENKVIQTAIIEILIEKGIFTKDEIDNKISMIREEKTIDFAADLMEMGTEDYQNLLKKLNEE